MGRAVTNGKDIWQGRPAISVNINTSAASGTRRQQRRNQRDDTNANDNHLRGDNFAIGQTHAGGDFVSFAGKYVEPKRPGGWLDPGPYGCLGAGLGAAIAARIARPDAQVTLLLGDAANTEVDGTVARAVVVFMRAYGRRRA
mgnify:CR=1 FL=1